MFFDNRMRPIVQSNQAVVTKSGRIGMPIAVAARAIDGDVTSAAKRGFDLR